MYVALIYTPISKEGLFVHGLQSSNHYKTGSEKRCTSHIFLKQVHGGGDDATHIHKTPTVAEFPYENDSSSHDSSTHLPPRTASEVLLFKRKKLKSKKKKSMDGKSIYHHHYQPVTENDIVQHVVSKYTTGPGGVLYTSEMKRKKLEDKTAADPTGSRFLELNTKQDGQYTDFLKKLDRHPALVLNANYQVSIRI